MTCTQMVINCFFTTVDTSSYAAKWLSNIQQRDTQPNPTYKQPNVIKCSTDRWCIICSQMVIKCSTDRHKANNYHMFSRQTQSRMVKHWANCLSSVLCLLACSQMVIKCSTDRWHIIHSQMVWIISRQTHSQMVIVCLMDWHIAKWLSNVLWTKTRPDDTEPDGYQMIHRQMTQPNGYSVFSRQTQSQMVTECSIDKHWAWWHTAKWLSNGPQTDDTSNAAKWL